MSDSPRVIDASHGEGGGQIVRSSLALSLLTRRPVVLENVRGGRKKPGLAAQHLTAVRAAAAVGAAAVEGDSLGSRRLAFSPGAVRAGDHVFDVGEAREGGSAGAAALVVQTVLLPLAFAEGNSTVTVRGGTHMEWSPPFDYLASVWGPALLELGVESSFELARFGFFPVGQGKIRATVRGRGRSFQPAPLLREERGPLLEVVGRAVAAELPSHIPQRMADRARSLLAAELAREVETAGTDSASAGTAAAAEAGAAAEVPSPRGVPETGAIGRAAPRVRVTPQRARTACPGAALFLNARYATGSAGFVAHGRLGKASEAVAEEAAGHLLAFHRSGAAVDAHLADQLIVPLAFASGPSVFVTESATGHLTTQAWLVERFGVAAVAIREASDGTARVTVEPAAG